MISTDVLYFIGHVDSASEERKNNYQEIDSEMSGYFQKLDTKSILMKDLMDLNSNRYILPSFELKHLTYSSLKNDFGFYITDGYNPVQNAKFPRWIGEIGLLFSLYDGFKKFLSTPQKFLIWLEDDTRIELYFENNFKIYMSNLPQDFDFIALGSRDDQKPLFFEYMDKFLIDNLAFSKAFQIYWAGAILISRSGAQKFIDEFETNGATYAWDWLIFNVRSEDVPVQKFNTYTIKPDLPQLFSLNLDISPDSTIINTTYTF